MRALLQLVLIPLVGRAEPSHFETKLVSVKSLFGSVIVTEYKGSARKRIHRYTNLISDRSVSVHGNLDGICTPLELITIELVKSSENFLFNLGRTSDIRDLKGKDLVAEAWKLEALGRDFNSLVEHIKSDVFQFILEDSANSKHYAKSARISSAILI